MKISDFGLSRETNQYKMDKNKKVPIKWLAPETMRQQIFSTKTDVWSFGIMIWEIFSNGKDPYPGMTNMEVMKKGTDNVLHSEPHHTALFVF